VHQTYRRRRGMERQDVEERLNKALAALAKRDGNLLRGI
jgi:hypothetical protein